MNVSNATIKIPKDIKSWKLKYTIDITSIRREWRQHHPVNRLSKTFYHKISTKAIECLLIKSFIKKIKTLAAAKADAKVFFAISLSASYSETLGYHIAVPANLSCNFFQLWKKLILRKRQITSVILFEACPQPCSIPNFKFTSCFYSAIL